MASISTSIELYDRVSAPIYRMIGALGNLTSAFESMETSVDGGFDTSQIEAARRATEQAALEVIQLGQGVEENENHQRRYNQSVRDGTSAMDSLVGKVVSLVSAYAGIQTLSKAADISDELTQTTARINLMNDGLQTTPELMDMIYQSAQNARGSFTDMATVVARFGNNAGEAFGSSEEVVAFANLVQKQMTIAGTSSTEASNAMLQLSQALGSGVLRGDELNSIFEQAPNLIRSIADYMDVPIGTIRAMAKEGELTADIVKSAIFASADEINAQFEQMPMTWNQVWTTMKNGALMQFQPVLEKINELANNQDFQIFATGIVDALATVSMHLLEIMEFAGMIAMFFSDNWSIIEPIIMGIVTALGLYYGAMILYNTITGISTAITAAKSFAETVHAASLAMQTGATFAATAAQHGFNAALLACPLTWILLIIIAVIAAIYAVVVIINKVTGATLSATGIILGVLTSAVSVIWNLFLTLLTLIIQSVVTPLTTAWDTFANFFGNIFNDPIATIIRTFETLANTVLGILKTIANGIDAIFGSNLSGAVQGWMDNVSSSADQLVDRYGNGTYEEKSSVTKDIQSLLDGVQTDYSWNTTDAYKTGYSWGKGIDDSVSNVFDSFKGGLDTSNLFEGSGYQGLDGYDVSQLPSNVADTAEDTDSMAKSMEISSEDLKYLRDIAETEVINRFTTAEIKVEMTNHNNVSSDMDLDGVVDYLASGVSEAMEKAAEGVHP